MEFPVWTIHTKAACAAKSHPPTPQQARKGKEAQAVPCAAGADGGIRNGRAGGVWGW